LRFKISVISSSFVRARPRGSLRVIRGPSKALYGWGGVVRRFVWV
jgi:hypothetical protein